MQCTRRQILLKFSWNGYIRQWWVCTSGDIASQLIKGQLGEVLNFCLSLYLDMLLNMEKAWADNVITRGDF